jgi:hypothetical protein
MQNVASRVSGLKINHFKNRDLKPPAKKLVGKLMYYYTWKS